MRIRKLSASPWITVAVAASAALAAGCSANTGAADDSALAQQNITVAASPQVDLAGLYIAQDDGFFASQGLHVTIEQLPSSQVVTAQLKGHVDIKIGRAHV